MTATHARVTALREQIAGLKKQVADAMNAEYPIGTVLLVNIRTNQKKPSRATVFATQWEHSDRVGYVRVRLTPTRYKPRGHAVDVRFDDIVSVESRP